MSGQLRRGTAADAPAVARLHIASWQAAYRGELSDEFLESQDAAVRTAEWRIRLENPATSLLLAEAEGVLLGFCACGPTGDADAESGRVWEIYNLHIAPELRGGGIGTRLFIAASELGRAAGAEALSLWVVDSNTPARRFYERHGMAPEGGRQVHPLGPGAALEEVRYRVGLDREDGIGERGSSST